MPRALAMSVQGTEACDGFAVSQPGTNTGLSTKPHCPLAGDDGPQAAS